MWLCVKWCWPPGTAPTETCEVTPPDTVFEQFKHIKISQVLRQADSLNYDMLPPPYECKWHLPEYNPRREFLHPDTFFDYREQWKMDRMIESGETSTTPVPAMFLNVIEHVSGEQKKKNSKEFAPRDKISRMYRYMNTHGWEKEEVQQIIEDKYNLSLGWDEPDWANFNWRTTTPPVDARQLLLDAAHKSTLRQSDEEE